MTAWFHLFLSSAVVLICVLVHTASAQSSEGCSFCNILCEGETGPCDADQSRPCGVPSGMHPFPLEHKDEGQGLWHMESYSAELFKATFGAPNKGGDVTLSISNNRTSDVVFQTRYLSSETLASNQRFYYTARAGADCTWPRFIFTLYKDVQAFTY